jgi:hypothetical protein
MQSIGKRIDALSPNEHFIIEPHEQMQLIETTLRNRISRANRLKHTNLKLHKETPPHGNWYIWNCPDSRKFNRHGNVISPDKAKLPKPSKPLQSSGSIHATTAQVCEHLNMTENAFNALPFDRQMKLRIDTGITLRDQRTKLAKLNQTFQRPDTKPSNAN